MKERPILFSAPMVRAILEGRKTQTRRVAKPQFSEWTTTSEGDLWPAVPVNNITTLMPSPYGKPGDRLWVRETWGVVMEHCTEDTFYGGVERTQSFWRERVQRDVGFVVCRADSGGDDGGEYWRPSIHMPRWASRITLEVTGVRVERVQDISTADAIAEGVIDDAWLEWREDVTNYAPPGSTIQDERGKFAQLWNEINAKRGYGWDVNPWVWVIEFKPI